MAERGDRLDQRGILGQPPAPARLAPYYDQMPDIARFYSRPRPQREDVPDEYKMAPPRQAQQGGARLTTAARKALPSSSFALPGGRYPINDPSHARNALSRVSQHGDAEEKARVRAAVHRKYPSIGQQAGARTPQIPAIPGMTPLGIPPRPPAPEPDKPKQAGARHSDEAQDRELIVSLLKQHGLINRQRGARWAPEHEVVQPGWFRMPAHHTAISITVKPRERDKQAGARMPSAPHPRMHALTMASATHLKNMGHISPAQHTAIHGDALAQLGKHKTKKPKLAPMPMPPPAGFGSIGPPPPPMEGAPGPAAGIPAGFAPPPMSPPEMQAGARAPMGAPPPKKYPKYGAGHYMSTPTPTGGGESAGARRRIY